MNLNIPSYNYLAGYYYYKVSEGLSVKWMCVSI